MSGPTCDYHKHEKWGIHKLNVDSYGNSSGNVKRQGHIFCSQHCAMAYAHGPAPAVTAHPSTAVKRPATCSDSPQKRKKPAVPSAAPSAAPASAPPSSVPRSAPASAASASPKGSGGRGGGVKEVIGDLFTATTSLAHCISCDIVMGAGIAKIFKSKFGGVDELKRQSAAQGRRTGGTLSLARDGRRIYYLITKEVYRDKPTYASVESSLKEMLKQCRQQGITSVSMPRIATGLDRLEWPPIKATLERVFNDSGVQIIVYEMPPRRK